MDEVVIQSLYLPSFSLAIIQISIDGKNYYPLSSLAQILGYSSSYNLTNLINKEYITSMDELYGCYLTHTQDSYSIQPCTYIQFNKGLKSSIPLFRAPYLFTNKEGVQQVLSRNTISCDKLKKEICEVLNIPSIIHLPSKETSFYTALEALLKDTNVVIKRQVYIAGYYADIELVGLENNVIIEYDENNHKWYDQNKEKQREDVLKSLGYTLLRIDDSSSPIESASLIFRQLLKLGLTFN